MQKAFCDCAHGTLRGTKAEVAVASLPLYVNWLWNESHLKANTHLVTEQQSC